MSLTWRDGFYLFAGILIGFLIVYFWIQIGLITLSNTILPKITIQAVNFNLNETALVEGINKTFGGMR